jgi:hypothetical protein
MIEVRTKTPPRGFLVKHASRQFGDRKAQLLQEPGEAAVVLQQSHQA